MGIEMMALSSSMTTSRLGSTTLRQKLMLTRQQLMTFGVMIGLRASIQMVRYLLTLDQLGSSTSVWHMTQQMIMNQLLITADGAS